MSLESDLRENPHCVRIDRCPRTIQGSLLCGLVRSHCLPSSIHPSHPSIHPIDLPFIDAITREGLVSQSENEWSGVVGCDCRRASPNVTPKRLRRSRIKQPIARGPAACLVAAHSREGRRGREVTNAHGLVNGPDATLRIC